MANAAISILNLTDSAALRSSSGATSLPVSNLKNHHVGRIWRTESNTGEWAIADLLDLYDISVVGLISTNLTSASEVRIRVSTDDPDGLTGLVYDSGTITGEIDEDYASLINILDTVEGRYVRIDLEDTSLTTIDIGRLFIGATETFDHNFTNGSGIQWTDRARITKSAGGQSLVLPDNKFRTVDLNFDFIPVAQRNGLWEDMGRLNGSSEDVLLIIDIESDNISRDTVFGLITSQIRYIYTAFGDIFSASLTVEQRL